MTSLLVFDDGSGPALYAGGSFTRSGATELNSVARWRGSAWEPVGAGFEGIVYTLITAEIDGEVRLVAGGSTGSFSSHPAIRHYWDGEYWHPLPGDVTGRVAALTHRNLPAGGELAAMGWMRTPELDWGWLLTAFDGAEWRPLGIDLVERGTFGFDIAVPPGIFEAFPWREEDALIIGTGYMKMELYSGALINHVTIFNSAGWCDPRADGVILASARSADGSFLIGGALTSFGGVDFIGPARLHINSCYADCDGSGELDFFDFLCFQNEFAAGAAGADCDGSGELDFFDFLCFQNEFAAGCP